MVHVPKTDIREKKVVKGLLARGGVLLGIAAVAHARGHRTMEGKWSVLLQETVAAVEQVLGALEEASDFDAVHYAVMKTMSHEPLVAPPKWAAVICSERDWLPGLGESLDMALLKPALSRRCQTLTPRQKGLAGMAVALCRSQDTLYAWAENLQEEEALSVRRMARLAQATVCPGEPSAVRGRVRQLLKELEGGQSS